MRYFPLLIGLALILSACGNGKPLNGAWTGKAENDTFAADVTFSGETINLTFVPKQTGTKITASGKFDAEEETLSTKIEKVDLDPNLASDQMKDAMKTAEGRKKTEDDLKFILSKQFSGAYQLDGSTLKILGNPTNILLTKK